MTKHYVEDRYFEWLYDVACGNRYSRNTSFRKLLMQLHGTEFTYSMVRDGNRAEDGMDLRYRFAYECKDIVDAERYLSGPCSVLEMMVALSKRTEETIMDDPRVGDRTGQWFWGMIANLGLGSMTDDNYDRRYVEDVVTRFLRREYEPDGRGGLFTIRNRNKDLRHVEIWYQLCWYLDSYT